MTSAVSIQPSDVRREIRLAEGRIRGRIRRTWVEPSPWLSEQAGGEVFLKLENLQITGSFKLRGAFNKILSLDEEQAARGVITASSGNHGMASAYALRSCGRKGVIYLPESVAPVKLEALKRQGAELRLQGRESGEAEKFARQAAEREGKVYISPYNDLQVVAGQGTLGLELAEDLPELDAVVIAVGGGGLISGVGSWLKGERPGLRVVAALPENSPVMYQCVRAGKIIDFPCRPTLSDGTAGSVEEGSLTFELCRQLVDDYILVSEEQILEAMRLLIVHHRQLVEGSAAVPVAALLKEKRRFAGMRTALVLCGGNVDLETVRRVVGPA